MATMNKFPPDVPKGWDEAGDEIDNATSGLRAKAADVADKATETVRGGYSRAKDALTDLDPIETARDGGQAVIRAVERNPVVAFGLGALGIGLIAWASLRSPPTSRWERYQPDFDRLRGLLGDYGKDAAKSGEGALKSSQQWLNAYGGDARDYAGYGGRLIAQRAQKEPIAALLGIGLAVYALGSLLGSSSSDPAPVRKRTAPKR
ncbi:hypothetical protein SAMN05216304_104167 [Bosea sp. OK403]|uniref:hypothetical protein n=1 Tax=Bosea sp. OK403 TaxID=1855286 RepID=UPI0008F02601|nr:hypothetical protein [Bosea sp. OK403]SFJ02494.1 hypothetical protein SAMN05216304_104167 [Bosea sp. OK403]